MGQIHRLRPHLAAVVIQSSLPANEVIKVLNDKLSDMSMGIVVAGTRCEAVINRPDRHSVGSVVVAIAGRLYV
jgi:hypothetical protein